MFSFSGLARENANVSGPSFPRNIMKTISIFPIGDRSAVIPIDRPTVPKAETTSNKIAKNGIGSVIFKIKIAVKINSTLIVEIASDRRINWSFSVFLAIEICFLPFKKVITDRRMTRNVVSLIPPPVDALPAPTNIRRSKSVIVLSRRLPMSVVLNPAVLGVTA